MFELPIPSRIDDLPAEVFIYLAVFTRVGALMGVAPGFGETSVPPRVKLMIALAVTVALAPTLRGVLPAMPTTVPGLALFLGGEALIGLALGALIRLFMGALQLAGTVIAFQSGLAFAQNFDPTIGVQGALVGTFLAVTATTMIFVTDLHHVMLAALHDSYAVFVPMKLLPVGDLAALAVDTVSKMFLVALQLSAPFIAFGLTFYLAAGVLSRLMPQVHIFFLAMPANIVIGFAIFSLTIGILMTWFLSRFAEHLHQFLS